MWTQPTCIDFNFGCLGFDVLLMLLLCLSAAALLVSIYFFFHKLQGSRSRHSAVTFSKLLILNANLVIGKKTNNRHISTTTQNSLTMLSFCYYYYYFYCYCYCYCYCYRYYYCYYCYVIMIIVMLLLLCCYCFSRNVDLRVKLFSDAHNLFLEGKTNRKKYSM